MNAMASGRFQNASYQSIEHAITFEEWDFDRAFEFGLTAIIVGLEQLGREKHLRI